LEKVILTTLQMQIRLAADHPKLIGRINQLPLLNRENIRQAQALSSMEELLRQQKDISDGLYMDWKKGEIGREQYLRLKEKAVKQIQHCEINIAQLNDEIANLSGGETGEAPADNNSYLNHFLCNGNIEKLSRGLVVALIDTIWVHEKGEIAIDANFADQYIPFG
jgi:hypothetical protein